MVLRSRRFRIWYNLKEPFCRLYTLYAGAFLISILIIGNEILSAQVEDTNLRHMFRKLNQVGYHIEEARFVRDEEETISEAIRELSRKNQFVISTGGIGPTHDDVTLTAYARAFEVPLIQHPELMEKVRSFFGDDLKPSSRRLTLVPQNTALIYAGPSSWPIIQVANCFVLPGLPEIFLKKFEGVLEALPPVPPRYFAALFTRSHETDFADQLTDSQKEYPDVEIGSYPTFEHAQFAAQITLKGGSLKRIQQAFADLKRLFSGWDSLVDWTEPGRYDPEKFHKK